MSGHSKWASIKHQKGAKDKARGKLFAKLIRQVEVAAREGGGDIEANATLRTMYAKARAASVPIDTIERAVKRGTGELEGVTYESITYEGYAPGGVAVMIDVLTDNRNRAGAEVRSLFSRMGGSMAEPGAVSWQFHKKGLITIEKGKIDEDALLSLALDAGAEDVKVGEKSFEVITNPQDFDAVKKALADAKIDTSLAEITYIPQNTIKLEEKGAEQMLKLMEVLDEHDDVQKVHANFDIPDDVMEKVAAAAAG